MQALGLLNISKNKISTKFCLKKMSLSVKKMGLGCQKQNISKISSRLFMRNIYIYIHIHICLYIYIIALYSICDHKADCLLEQSALWGLTPVCLTGADWIFYANGLRARLNWVADWGLTSKLFILFCCDIWMGWGCLKLCVIIVVL